MSPDADASAPGASGAPRPPRVTCIVGRTPTAALLQEVVATLLPGAEVSALDSAVVRSVPDADCVVIDVEVNGDEAVEVLRLLRARGYAGGAVLVRDEAADVSQAAALGLGATAVVERGALVRDLARAVDSATGDRGELGLALRRAQRVAAAGEIALGLQHALNNPLAALLAEAQLLELEPMDPEHLQTVRRMIDLCRRLVDEVRRLDGIGR